MPACLSYNPFYIFMDKIMDSIFIKKIELKNNLIMEMFDCSRPIAGDRWQVVFEIRIDVALTPEYFSDACLSGIMLEDALTLLGDRTTYTYKKERNFIAEDEKPVVLENMEIDFLKTNLDYFSSAEFAFRLIRRNYKKAHSQMILSKKQNSPPGH